MRIKEIIKAKKEWGDWHTGKVPHSLFYLSKSGKLKYGSSYEWRVVKFRALNCDFRLLVAISLAKEQYHARLALDEGSDSKLLISYEFHGTHPGWHVHAACVDSKDIPSGRYTGEWKKRLPRNRAYHRRTVFGVTKDSAVDKAAKFFGLYKSDDQSNLL